MLPFSIINEYGNTVIAPEIKKIHGNESHIGILYNTGELYLRGDNGQGELGTGDKVNIYTSWYLTRSAVSNFWVGLYSTLIRTTDNRFFYVGQKRHYGEATDSTNVTVWTEITSKIVSQVGSIDSIKSIALGTYSSLILRIDGNLYAAGTNGWGELGTGSAVAVRSYTLTNTNVQKAFLSTLFSYVIKNDGTLYSSGHNQVGQLGTNSSATYLATWTACTFNSSNTYVTDVGLGADTAHIMSSTSSSGITTYSACGANNNGKLGLGSTNTFYRTFTLLSGVVITKFNNGSNENATSCSFITSNGVYSAGAAAVPSGISVASTTFKGVTSSPFVNLPLIKSITLAGGLSQATESIQIVEYGSELYAVGGSTWLSTGVGARNEYIKIAAPK